MRSDKPGDMLPSITSRHNPIVPRFRAAARGESASLLLDGVHLVEEALEAGVTLREVAVAASAVERDDLTRLIEQCRRQRVSVVAASAPVMSALSPTRSSSPIVALADRPPARSEDMYRPPSLVVVLVDIQDPGNVGAMIRTAEAFGATGVVAAGTSADPFGWKALRGSMGSGLRLGVTTSRDRDETVLEARRHGCRIFATVPRGGRPPGEADFSTSSAILIGGEGAGLAGDLIDLADEQLTIPMQASVESLNAAVAATVVLYSAFQQRSRRAQVHSSI